MNRQILLRALKSTTPSPSFLRRGGKLHLSKLLNSQKAKSLPSGRLEGVELFLVFFFPSYFVQEEIECFETD